MAKVSEPSSFDLVVIGGGINGAGIARDAAGRGLSVLLCEKDDLASATSSASTKLIHGGLRYLEHYAFRLVRESLIEREVLLRAAPHIIWPMRFVLPHNRSLRPAWMIRAGLFLYDHLGGRELLPGSQGVNLRKHPAGEPLQGTLGRGFIYSDCWVQDARLVVLNAVDAAARGAEVLTRTECLTARRADGRWTITLRDVETDAQRTISARGLVNAAGPWVSSVLESRIGANRPKSLRLVQGSHIVVPKLFDHEDAYLFQNPDRRIVFAIPYERDFTLIGTTDRDYTGDPDDVAITPGETDYLCAAVNVYFRKQISPDDVVWSYSGVRPLFDDSTQSASEVTRDYVLDLDQGDGAAPVLLNVFGGKLTTYRKLAEHALEKLAPALDIAAPGWTAETPLPGGDIENADFSAFLAGVRAEYPWLPNSLAWRLARDYGTRIGTILADARSMEDLGTDFGAGFTEAEAQYLMDEEWARTAEDMLWRRSKMGLHGGPEIQDRISAWIAARVSKDQPRKVPAA